MNPEQLTRYSRHILLPEIGAAGQERLLRSRVLVIGAGGLGSPAALYLAAAGVGTLGLADFDAVELHNLQRQILHREATVGQPKLDSAAATLRALNASVELRLHPEGVRPHNALELFAGYDLIIDGSDNFPTRYLNTDAACLAGKALVYGSIFQFEGQVTLFHPATGTPCYRCLFPTMPPPDSVPNCAEAGVLGALCGMIGSLQALEAIKFLTGAGVPLASRMLVVDGLAGRFSTVRLRKDPACPLCGPTPRIRAIDPAAYAWNCASAGAAVPEEIDPAAARALLAAAPPPLLIDVREDDERAICQLPAGRHIPLRHLPAHLAELPRAGTLIVYCHHGYRSLRAARLLREHGLAGACSLAGGIDRWAREVDPAMARY
jgi:adenylyltransferase/sulfurtransferase